MSILSHHAPTRRLLQNFMWPQPFVQGESRVWVYRKSIRPREAYSLRAESAENGYFAGDPAGRSESVIERELNLLYEAPFHALLPTLTSPLVHLISAEIIPICAAYMGNMFLRAKPLRMASKLKFREVHHAFQERVQSEATLRQYAAVVSFRIGKPVSIEELRTVLIRVAGKSDRQSEAVFFRQATMGLSGIPEKLASMRWDLCETSGVHLIQSDAAIALLNSSPLGDRKTRYGMGIGRLGSEWYMPISPSRCIRASPERITDRILSTALVNEINEYLLRAAVSSVYSAIYNDDLRQAVGDHLHTLRFLDDLLTINIDSVVEDLLHFSGHC